MVSLLRATPLPGGASLGGARAARRVARRAAAAPPPSTTRAAATTPSDFVSSPPPYAPVPPPQWTPMALPSSLPELFTAVTSPALAAVVSDTQSLGYWAYAAARGAFFTAQAVTAAAASGSTTLGSDRLARQGVDFSAGDTDGLRGLLGSQARAAAAACCCRCVCSRRCSCPCRCAARCAACRAPPSRAAQRSTHHTRNHRPSRRLLPQRSTAVLHRSGCP
jgi:hypothetical protein